MQFRSLLVTFTLAFVTLNAWATATLESMTGDVRLLAGGRAASTATVNQQVQSGTTISTGSRGQAILRFDDGQMVAINADSSFKIDQYHYDAAKPEQDNISLSLLKGAMRLVTGLIGKRNNSRFSLATPTATVGIRGTDFMVALVTQGAANPAYMQVIQGSIAATNTAGTVAFAAGTTGTVASAATLATSIAASALPAAVSATFSQLGSLSLAGAAGTASSAGTGATPGGAASGGAGAGGAGGAGAGAATAAAAGGISVGAVAAGALAAGVVASMTSSTGTTGTAQ